MLYFINTTTCIEILARAYAKETNHGLSFTDPLPEDQDAVKKEALSKGYGQLAIDTDLAGKTIEKNKGLSKQCPFPKTIKAISNCYRKKFSGTEYFPIFEEPVLSLLELYSSMRKRIGNNPGQLSPADIVFTYIDRLADGMLDHYSDEDAALISYVRASIRSDILGGRKFCEADIDGVNIETVISYFDFSANLFMNSEHPLLEATCRLNSGILKIVGTRNSAADVIGNDIIIKDLSDLQGGRRSILDYAADLWYGLDGAYWPAPWIGLISAAVMLRRNDFEENLTRLNLYAGGHWPFGHIPPGQSRSLANEEYLHQAREDGWLNASLRSHQLEGVQP